MHPRIGTYLVQVTYQVSSEGIVIVALDDEDFRRGHIPLL